jgi:hypothetical protein
MDRQRWLSGVVAAACAALLVAGEARAEGRIARRQAREQARIAREFEAGSSPPARRHVWSGAKRD